MRLAIVIITAFCVEQSFQQLEDAAYWETIASSELLRALDTEPNTNRARKVILFVGDGMGLNTNTAARIYKGQLAGEGTKAEKGRLIFEEFPHLGLLKTYNVDMQVPDSASTATALFCGAKANHKTVGVDANVKLEDCEASLNSTFHLKSIIQWAQESGMRTGFVTNTRVTHATPSALYAHSPQRSWECEAKMPKSASKCKDIARQLIEDEPGRSINVIFGGGRQCLVSNVTGTTSDPIDTWACYSSDGRNLINDWKTQKSSENVRFEVVSNQKELQKLDTKSVDYVLGVFNNGFMKYEYERDYKVDPSLADMTTAAIEILDKSDDGFLLVVESGMIDQAHHRGTAKMALHETAVVLENAVRETLRKVNVYEDALVIVTADHSHTLSISGYPKRGNDILGIAEKSKTDALNYTTLTYATGTEIKYFAINATHISRTDPSTENLRDFRYQQQSTIATDEAVHGGNDVAVYAKGPWAHLFHTLHEQNYVAHVIGHAAKIGPYKSHGSSPTAPSTLLLVIGSFCMLYYRLDE